MGIGNRQNLAGAVGEPAVTGTAVAFGAVAVAAGAILGELMGAVIALPQVSAEGGGSACADVAERLTLLAREHVAPAVEEFLPVAAEDIGDFQSLLAHRWRALSTDRSMGFTGRESKGLGAACRCLVETWR